MSDASSVFSNYASYYDTVYQDKDYEAECDFVLQMLADYASAPVKSILDMGCGTGGHAVPLVQRGYTVTGVDFSQDMLDRARARADDAGKRVDLHLGDVRDLSLGKTYDAAILMFAVLAYQTGNADLHGTLLSARRHLKPGGLLFFDTWSGSGVVADPPAVRVREFIADGDTRLMRIVTPRHDPFAQTVEVNIHILHINGDGVLDEVRESHGMRYVFPQEITFHLEQAGFKLRKIGPFMQPDADLRDTDWHMAVVAEAV